MDNIIYRLYGHHHSAEGSNYQEWENIKSFT